MTQIAQLSEAEIEARFHIRGTRPVAFMLAEFVRDRAQFSVQFGGGQQFLTALLAVDAATGNLVFDCSGSEELNQKILAAERTVFVGRPDGIHVQFACAQPRAVMFEGAKAFALALPKHIVRLQRRDAFRIDTPRAKPLEFFGRMFDGALVKMPAHDISVAGIGLTASQLPEGLVSGAVLEKCHFHLPDDTEELYFMALVAHVTEQEARAGFRQWRVGLNIRGLQPREESRIQRYIARVERERHELS